MPKIITSTYEKLEMSSIIKNLIDFSVIENNKIAFENLEESTDIEYIKHMLDVTDEALVIINRFERAPLYISNNYFPLLEIVSKGGVLTALELYETVRLNHTIKANIRQLEGALTRLIAYSATWGCDITLPLAQEAPRRRSHIPYPW